MARKARRDFGHAPFTAQESDVYHNKLSHDDDNNAHMCIGVVITQ